ncbi:hypothetical protein AAON49_01445 [Pseudotenacibaculum sp. MALMAid0570]|uniref:hypothetical protein n=1 Tax=Pseudotenacibaculum sp. MALMAid0570 TaxID=3143938 RepID=UPI0032DF611E
MLQFKKLTKTETLLFSALAIVLILSVYFGFSDGEYFDTVFAREDGAVEYATFFFLLCISILQFYRLFTASKNKAVLWKLGIFFFGVLFLFGAGEEISWGQRIFGIESGDFFKDNNLQNEINLHNLEIGGVKLNKLIFSQLLTVVMALYLLVLPFLYQKYEGIKKLVNKFVIPVPQLSHITAFLINTIFIAILPNLSRKWEVYELFFAVIFLLIFLNPINKNIYLRESGSNS